MKAFPVELERLLKEHLVLDRPLVWEWREICQILHGAVQIVFVPKEHSQSLLSIVAKLFL